MLQNALGCPLEGRGARKAFRHHEESERLLCPLQRALGDHSLAHAACGRKETPTASTGCGGYLWGCQIHSSSKYKAKTRSVSSNEKQMASEKSRRIQKGKESG